MSTYPLTTENNIPNAEKLIDCSPSNRLPTVEMLACDAGVTLEMRERFRRSRAAPREICEAVGAESVDALHEIAAGPNSPERDALARIIAARIAATKPGELDPTTEKFLGWICETPGSAVRIVMETYRPYVAATYPLFDEEDEATIEAQRMRHRELTPEELSQLD